MSREVRRVPANWEHPKDEQEHLIPLKDNFKKEVAQWDLEAREWENGFWLSGLENERIPKNPDQTGTFEEFDGPRPEESDYMPDWPKSERTHYQMYESVTEGTPISPVMETPEALAQWLADNKANAGPHGRTATYEQWLAMIKAGSSVGTFAFKTMTGEITSGVEEVSR